VCSLLGEEATSSCTLYQFALAYHMRLGLEMCLTGLTCTRHTPYSYPMTRPGARIPSLQSLTTDAARRTILLVLSKGLASHLAGHPVHKTLTCQSAFPIANRIVVSSCQQLHPTTSLNTVLGLHLYRLIARLLVDGHLPLRRWTWRVELRVDDR
jgi:hypothetical protein